MKSITVVRSDMSLTQRREAYLFAEKHDRDFSKVKVHTWEGSTGNFEVRNLKRISVRLVK